MAWSLAVLDNLAERKTFATVPCEIKKKRYISPFTNKIMGTLTVHRKRNLSSSWRTVPEGTRSKMKHIQNDEDDLVLPYIKLRRNLLSMNTKNTDSTIVSVPTIFSRVVLEYFVKNVYKSNLLAFFILHPFFSISSV